MSQEGSKDIDQPTFVILITDPQGGDLQRDVPSKGRQLSHSFGSSSITAGVLTGGCRVNTLGMKLMRPWLVGVFLIRNQTTKPRQASIWRISKWHRSEGRIAFVIAKRGVTCQRELPSHLYVPYRPLLITRPSGPTSLPAFRQTMTISSVPSTLIRC